MSNANIHGVGLGTTLTEQHDDPRYVARDGDLLMPVVLASTARDAYGSPVNSPTTTLRPCLVLARLSSGGKFTDYLNGEAGGRGAAVAVLMEKVNMLSDAGVAEDKLATALFGGVLDEDKLLNIDADGKTDLRGTYHVTFKEDIYG